VALSQVVDFGFESGIVDLQVGEATVGSMELTFLDPKTNSPKTQGATKPSVIERHLTTQVRLAHGHRCSCCVLSVSEMGTWTLHLAKSTNAAAMDTGQDTALALIILQTLAWPRRY
jgi:hypothetical protein